MKNQTILKLGMFIIVVFFALGATVRAEAQSEPAVHAILFYSPTCPHCHEVMAEDLPPLMDIYGTQLQILQVDTTTNAGQLLYQGAVRLFEIPNERLGVPNLTVGGTYLVGSGEIPQFFPQIIADGLAAGGIDWPDLPGLAEILAEETFTFFGEFDVFAEPKTLGETFSQDPVGNSLSVVVLLGMIGVLVWVGRKSGDRRYRLPFQAPKFTVPVLAFLGVGISAYLTYVEMTGSDAVCGPVGDCNAVQLSEYATVFGLFSIASVGLIVYAGLFAVWVYHTGGPEEHRETTHRLMQIATWAGILFSIYLTFLEPFVIGATCIWCISSAIVMAALFFVINMVPKPNKMRRPSRRMGPSKKRKRQARA